MKKLIAASALLAMSASLPVYAHHGASGIISDELWADIDNILSDTPHNEVLELRLDDTTMGRTSVVTTVNVDDENVDDALSDIYSALGELSNGASTFLVEPVSNGDGTTDINIYEPIGSGRSQTVPGM